MITLTTKELNDLLSLTVEGIMSSKGVGIVAKAAQVTNNNLPKDVLNHLNVLVNECPFRISKPTYNDLLLDALLTKYDELSTYDTSHLEKDACSFISVPRNKYISFFKDSDDWLLTLNAYCANNHINADAVKAYIAFRVQPSIDLNAIIISRV